MNGQHALFVGGYLRTGAGDERVDDGPRFPFTGDGHLHVQTVKYAPSEGGGTPLSGGLSEPRGCARTIRLQGRDLRDSQIARESVSGRATAHRP